MQRGRRPGRSATRARILATARQEFAEKGYERVTLRGVAHLARVDQRLVTHFFGSKQGLFVAAIELPIDPATFVAAVTAPGVKGIGERLVTHWLALGDSAEGPRLIGLLRAAASNEAAARMVRDVFVHVVLRQLVRSLDVDRVELRASFVASQLFGLVLARYVLRLDPLASMSAREAARWIGPTVQRYLESGARSRKR